MQQGSVRFLNVFECSPRLHLFDQKYSKNSNTVKYYFTLKQMFSILIYLKNNIPVMQSWIFSIQYSNLKCHMILKKSFEYTDLMLKKHV